MNPEHITLLLAALAKLIEEMLGDNDDPSVAFLLVMASAGFTQCIGNTSQKTAAAMVESLLEHLNTPEDSPARPGAGPMNQ